MAIIPNAMVSALMRLIKNHRKSSDDRADRQIV
jgi:hypothetical protein